MQKLIINKNVYDTMLGHFGDKLQTIAKEFNDYLTPDNVVKDYANAYHMIKFNGSQGKTITFITHLEPSVKNKLNCKKVKELDVSFDAWFEPEYEFEPDELLGKYFQLFVIRKIDYFGNNIISSDDKDFDEYTSGIHSRFLSLHRDCNERRIAALMAILLTNCSVSDQRRIMTIIQMKFRAEDKSNDSEFNVFFDALDLFIHAQIYKH